MVQPGIPEGMLLVIDPANGLVLCLVFILTVVILSRVDQESSSSIVAAHILKLKEHVSNLPADASELFDTEAARKEIAILRHDISELGEISTHLTRNRRLNGFLRSVVDWLKIYLLNVAESVGGPHMFGLFVRLGLRSFCPRAKYPHNPSEIAARQGLTAYNINGGWRVMEPDGSTHDQNTMTIGCDHAERWIKVPRVWAKLYIQYWLPRVPHIGYVVYLHDYGGHSGEIAHLLPQFLSHGLIMVSYDMRGHGRSSGIHGLIPAMKELIDDLQLVLDCVRDIYPSTDNNNQTNVFLFGTGLGALTALHYVVSRRGHNHIAGVILQQPLLTLDRPYSSYDGASNDTNKLVASMFPALPLHESPTDGIVAEEFMDRLHCDEMRYHGRMRSGTRKAIEHGTKNILRLAHFVNLPILIQEVASDFASIILAERLIKEIPSKDKKLMPYKAGASKLMFESTPFRNKVTDEVVDWIESHLSEDTTDVASCPQTKIDDPPTTTKKPNNISRSRGAARLSKGVVSGMVNKRRASRFKARRTLGSYFGYSSQNGGTTGSGRSTPVNKQTLDERGDFDKIDDTLDTDDSDNSANDEDPDPDWQQQQQQHHPRTDGTAEDIDNSNSNSNPPFKPPRRLSPPEILHIQQQQQQQQSSTSSMKSYHNERETTTHSNNSDNNNNTTVSAALQQQQLQDQAPEGTKTTTPTAADAMSSEHNPQDFKCNDEYRHELPDMKEWPDFPVLVRCSPDVAMEVSLPGQKSAYGALPINDTESPIPFETALFKGVAMIRIADLASSPSDYFKGRRRKMQVAIQGRFKRPLRMDQVYGGQEFSEPLCNIPGRWLIRWALSLLRSRLPPTFKHDAFASRPFFLSPLISTSQAVRADRDTPQDITDTEILEENRALGPQFQQGNIGAEARKKVFVDTETLSQYTFDPEVTYTFDYYQQFFRAGLFALDLGVKLLDLAHYVGRQPLCLTMAKTMDTNEYLWKFDIWHQKLVELNAEENLED